MIRFGKSTCADEVKTDEELVELILAGQGEVFARLYERYHLRTYRLAYGMTGRREAAEDLTQEVFLRAYQKLGQFKGNSRFATWFYRLSVNHCLQHRQRAHEFTEETVEDWEQVMSQSQGEMSVAREAESALSQQQAQAIIHKALLSLKPDLRVAVILRNLEGLSYEEVAERMNCSVGTVGTRLYRAHKLLARKLAGLRGEY
jgi:RNA polymerase sigma-70 factor (ECF subfamily)